MFFFHYNSEHKSTKNQRKNSSITEIKHKQSLFRTENDWFSLRKLLILTSWYCSGVLHHRVSCSVGWGWRLVSSYHRVAGEGEAPWGLEEWGWTQVLAASESFRNRMGKLIYFILVRKAFFTKSLVNEQPPFIWALVYVL